MSKAQINRATIAPSGMDEEILFKINRFNAIYGVWPTPTQLCEFATKKIGYTRLRLKSLINDGLIEKRGKTYAVKQKTAGRPWYSRPILASAI